MGSKITLTNNEAKDIMKIITCLENRWILLKGTSKKISQKEEILNFLAPLMKVDLSLIKNVPTPLAKSVLVPLALTAVSSATNAGIQKKTYGSGLHS